ncbi:MAG: succinylglutamate desuccinylase/aspartoacylase family protein [Bdellovibrionales bacterium]|nr:succinylglutamate desuccinylase/aspartoacylase family protein [Bdellovibrionales bacterium]
MRTPSGIFHFESETPGPRVVIFGGVHGDEPSGVETVCFLRDQLTSGSIKLQCGSLTLAIANERAVERSVRFIEENLNRLFFLNSDSPDSCYERARAIELAPLIRNCDFFFDLHSTRAPTEPFLMCESHLLPVASNLGASNIVVGWASLNSEALSGDTESYGNSFGIPSFTMESGQHLGSQTCEVAKIMALNVLKFTKLISGEILSIGERKVFQLFAVQNKTSDSFSMARAFRNLEPVRVGELLAEDGEGQILAPENCVIVLPKVSGVVGAEMYLLARECS